jgi:RNA polymerase sigma-70 factor (ECF subfamily)
MVRALRGFPQFRGGNGRAWLLAIVRNSCYTYLRRRPPEAPVAEPDPSPDPRPDPEERLAQKMEGERLRRALGALPVEFREVIILREFEGLSYKAIGEIAEIPLGTVMSRLARARQKLQEALGPSGGGR